MAHFKKSFLINATVGLVLFRSHVSFTKVLSTGFFVTTPGEPMPRQSKVRKMPEIDIESLAKFPCYTGAEIKILAKNPGLKRYLLP